MLFYLFVLAGFTAAESRFHAESQYTCRVCRESVSFLKEKIRVYNEHAVSMVMFGSSHWVDQEQEGLLRICHKTDQADCSGFCKTLSEEIRRWDLGEVQDPEATCINRGWCESEQLRKMADIPAQLTAEQIQNINNDASIPWTAGFYEHRNTSRAQFRRTLGAIVDPKLTCKPKYVSTFVSDDIPDEFDSETNWPNCKKVIGDIRDQSMCGCCWAFAAASAASDRFCIANDGKVMFPLSAQSMCFCASSDGCDGGSTFYPWAFLSDGDGIPSGGQVNGTGPFGLGQCADFTLPHCHHHGPQRNDPYPAEGQPGCLSQSSQSCPKKCDSTANGVHSNLKADMVSFKGLAMHYPSTDAIQTAIMKEGPVEAAFTVWSDFANYVSGIYTKTAGTTMEGGHAIRIVGWGSENGIDYWKIANSWNPYWGENGYFRIVRGIDECGIESNVYANNLGATWHWEGQD